MKSLTARAAAIALAVPVILLIAGGTASAKPAACERWANEHPRMLAAAGYALLDGDMEMFWFYGAMNGSYETQLARC